MLVAIYELNMALLPILLVIFSTTILSYETASLPEPRIVDDVTVPELECSGSNTVVYPATITSPNYGGYYPNYADCSFTLIPRPGQAVYLEFTHFGVSILIYHFIVYSTLFAGLVYMC